MKFKVVIRRDENQYFVASCPAIKGCHSQGKTKDEALKNIKEAIEGCLEVLNGRVKKTRDCQVYEVSVR